MNGKNQIDTTTFRKKEMHTITNTSAMLVSHPRNMNHIQQLDPSKSTNVDLVREKEPVIFVFFFFGILNILSLLRLKSGNSHIPTPTPYPFPLKPSLKDH